MSWVRVAALPLTTFLSLSFFICSMEMISAGCLCGKRITRAFRKCLFPEPNVRVNQLDGWLGRGLVLLLLVFCGIGEVRESVFFKPKIGAHGLINSDNKAKYLKWDCSKKIKDCDGPQDESCR